MCLLSLGAVLLAFGLNMGFVRHANPALVFSLLGVGAVVFVVVLCGILSPETLGFNDAAHLVHHLNAPLSPEPTPTPVSYPPVAAAMQLKAASVCDATLPSLPAPSVSHSAAKDPAPQANSDLRNLMVTTIGDILELLQAALSKDRKDAGDVTTASHSHSRRQ
jgi:hypothetical protein